MIQLDLSIKDIDKILENRKEKRWGKMLDVYAFLQEHLRHADAEAIKSEYQRKFNHFYQVRRNAEWREKFYAIFYEATKKNAIDFATIMQSLSRATGRVEMSFASKMVATIEPSLPVIDRHVLSYVGQKVPKGDTEERIAKVVRLHDEMKQSFDEYLSSAPGEYLVKRFETLFDRPVNKMKMLDFVLWLSGGKKTIKTELVHTALKR